MTTKFCLLWHHRFWLCGPFISLHLRCQHITLSQTRHHFKPDHPQALGKAFANFTMYNLGILLKRRLCFRRCECLGFPSFQFPEWMPLGKDHTLPESQKAVEG